MKPIVCKFGGTSLANATQMTKAIDIVLSDPARRVVVVSAPGKRHADDIKLTDSLYALADAAWHGSDTSQASAHVVERVTDIAKALALDSHISQALTTSLKTRLVRNLKSQRAFVDRLVAFGEWASATLMTAALSARGVFARCVDPADAGLRLAREGGVTHVVSASDARLANHLTDVLNEGAIAVIPGFYGADDEGQIVTFTRGGSDISGAIMARAVNALRYEVWSDVDAVYTVNPAFVPHPHPIEEMSYREMRELAYIGFTILHPEALQPVVDQAIPIAIKNTDRPEMRGTAIVPTRTTITSEVTGIAAADRFAAISMRRVLSNAKIGVLASILTLFAEADVAVEHVPTGIDSISVVVREDTFPPDVEARLCQRLRDELGFPNVIVARDLSAVMLVGEGMLDSISVISRAADCLRRERISVEVMLQDYYEISILFMMSRDECRRAVPALYRAFFTTDRTILETKAPLASETVQSTRS